MQQHCVGEFITLSLQDTEGGGPRYYVRHVELTLYLEMNQLDETWLIYECVVKVGAEQTANLLQHLQLWTEAPLLLVTMETNQREQEGNRLTAS